MQLLQDVFRVLGFAVVVVSVHFDHVFWWFVIRYGIFGWFRGRMSRSSRHSVFSRMWMLVYFMFTGFASTNAAGQQVRRHEKENYVQKKFGASEKSFNPIINHLEIYCKVIFILWYKISLVHFWNNDTSSTIFFWKNVCSDVSRTIFRAYVWQHF